MALGFLGTAHAQKYFVSTPVNGYVQLAVEDAAGSGSACGSGNAGFGILNDTVYLNLNADTIREVGSVSLGGGGSFSFDDGRIVDGSNGLQFVAANVTLSLSVPNALSFDTGVQPLVWVPAIQSYVFTAPLGSVPVTGTYSVVNRRPNVQRSVELQSVYGNAPAVPANLHFGLSGLRHPRRLRRR